MWTCYTYSPAQEAGSSPQNAMGTALSELSRSKTTPDAFCSPDKLTDRYLASLFGMTCEHSEQTTPPRRDTSTGYDDSLISVSRAGSRARTSAPQERAQESTGNEAGYGLSFPVSSARYDPAARSWRIHPCLFPEDSIGCSVTLPRWGTMRSGELLERTTPELDTSEIGSGLWPTPVAQDAKNATLPPSQAARNSIPGTLLRDGVSGALNPDWVEWLMGWPIGWTALHPMGELDYPAPHEWTEDPAEAGTVLRVSQGTRNRNARLKAIGNGQVPAAASLAWSALSDRIAEKVPSIATTGQNGGRARGRLWVR